MTSPPERPSDVGVLMLDNALPRPIGDVGNPDTFGFALSYRVIEGASTDRVVERSAAGLLDSVRISTRTLLERGCRTLATCCGFLAIFQRELAESTPIPAASSSLLQIPMILQTLRGSQRVAVITINAATLTDDHFAAVGVGPQVRDRVRVVGLEQDSHLYPVIVDGADGFDQQRAETEVVAAARSVLEADDSIGAFVFECTNLPPYAQAVRDATGLPVWDATSMINWLRAGVHDGWRA